MDESESLSDSKWECKYHLVFIPKCRRKVLYEQPRRNLGEVFRALAEQKQCRILEGHLMPVDGDENPRGGDGNRCPRRPRSA